MGRARVFNSIFGGTTGALDRVASSAITNGDIAFVVTTGAAYFYSYVSTLTAAESTVAPWTYVRPDDYGLSGVWRQTTVYTPLTTAMSTVVSTAAGAWDTAPTTVAPVAPEVGHFYWADNAGWDPIGSTGAEQYFALYTTDSTYVGIVDLAGNLLLSGIDIDLTSVSTADDSIPSAKAVKTALDLKADIAGGPLRAQEVAGNASTTLTTSQMANAIIYNTGQTTADVVLTLPAAGVGLSGLFVVGTTVANDWKVRASTANKFYAIASSDGSISAGATAGYYGFDATTSIGLSFAVWSFRSSTVPDYDWLAKCISGTPSTSAPA
jgi:hypothetical protein